MTLRRLAIDLLVMAAIGFALGLLGPLGTYATPPALRILLWIVFIVGGYAVFRPAIAAAGWLASATGMPRIAAGLIACALGSLPVAFGVGLLMNGGSVARLARDRDFLSFYAQVLLIGLGVYGLMTLLFRREQATAPPNPAQPPERAPEPASLSPAEPPFLRRLPPSLGAPLLCLEMEDHYVRAHLPGGSALILMRLRDAIAELEGIDGAHVHRSWWVARAAVAGVERRERALSLRLVNGLVIPVARNALPALRLAGWLER